MPVFSFIFRTLSAFSMANGSKATKFQLENLLDLKKCILLMNSCELSGEKFIKKTFLAFMGYKNDYHFFFYARFSSNK